MASSFTRLASLCYFISLTNKYYIHQTHHCATLCCWAGACWACYNLPQHINLPRPPFSSLCPTTLGHLLSLLQANLCLLTIPLDQKCFSSYCKDGEAQSQLWCEERTVGFCWVCMWNPSKWTQHSIWAEEETRFGVCIIYFQMIHSTCVNITASLAS